MLNGETEQKQSVHFFALMLALSLCMHTALCIFFYCIGVTILYVFNIASDLFIVAFFGFSCEAYGEMDVSTICRSACTCTFV